MKKPLLIIVLFAVIAAVLAARQKVNAAEAEAALWAEATDPIN